MAKKKKRSAPPTRKAREPEKKAPRSSPAGKVAPAEGPAAQNIFGAKLLAETDLVSCPARPYSGTVQLDDVNGESFLQMQGGTVLLMIDLGCTGVFDPQGVARAYEIYRVNPGRNGSMSCQGFLHQDSVGLVLHVVR
jgi:hypothetical protein